MAEKMHDSNSLVSIADIIYIMMPIWSCPHSINILYYINIVCNHKLFHKISTYDAYIVYENLWIM